MKFYNSLYFGEILKNRMFSKTENMLNIHKCKVVYYLEYFNNPKLARRRIKRR